MLPETQTLLRLIDGELRTRAARRVEAHVAECAECSREVARLEDERTWFALNDAAAGLAPLPAAVGLARVHAAIMAEPAVHSNARRRSDATAACHAQDDAARAWAEASAALETFVGVRAAHRIPSPVDAVAARVRTLAARIPDFVFAATVLVIGSAVVALCGWQATGNPEWIRIFFHYPGAISLVALYGLELSLGIFALRQFSPGEPFRRAWWFLTAAAGCHFTGGILVHLLGGNAALSPLGIAGLGAGSQELAAVGARISGPVQMALLATGIFMVLRAARRHGFLPPVSWLDVGTLGAICALAGWHLVNRAGAAGFPSVALALECVQVFLILALLAEAILLRRAVMNMQWGIAARCWGAFSAAIYLTCIANVTVPETGSSAIPGPLAGAVWCLWLVAAGAYALAPAYQVYASAAAGQRRLVGIPARTARALAHNPTPGC